MNDDHVNQSTTGQSNHEEVSEPNQNTTSQPDSNLDASNPVKPSSSMQIENGEPNPDQNQEEESNELIDSQKYVEGLIYPPPEIRTIVDKTAAFIAKNPNPQLFEDKIRQREKTDSRFSFLSPDDAYNAYYRHQIQSIKNGDVPNPTAPNNTTTSSSAAPVTNDADPDKPPEPAPLAFLIEPDQMPKINSVDLEIIKLTALFTARLGRKFVSDLSSRESRNYQFDFLRPAHSLFGFFNRLVEQYTKVLIPTPETLERLERLAGGKAIDRKRLDVAKAAQAQKERTIIGKREVMSEVESRIKWERYKGLELKKKTTEEEKEKKEFNEIDWEDFIVVSTVEFTENDEVIDLPPPMSISEVENMTIAQKKMAAMVMEGKDMSTIDEEQLNATDLRHDQEANEMLEDAKRSAEEAKAKAAAEDQDESQRDEDDDNKTQNKQLAEIKKLNTTGMKIRKDYVPKNKQLQTAQQQAQNAKVITTLCQICGQQINVNEISEHVRIELLDPRWKEKKQTTELNRSSSNMLTLGSDVSSSLRDLAKSRLDIFEENVTEEEKMRREAEQKKLKQLAKEKYTWDGHINTGERITNIYQTGANLDEQIQALHRSKGLTGESIHSGPQIGPLPGAMPAQAPPPQPNPTLLQQQQLQLQQQQIQQHIQNITSGLTGSGEPIPPNMTVHQQPSFGGGATLSAAPQPLSARPPLIDPGRAAMMSGSMPPPMMNLGVPPQGVIPMSSPLAPGMLPPPNPADDPNGGMAGANPGSGLSPNPAQPANGLPPLAPGGFTTLAPPGLPGRPNVPDFGAGIPGPPPPGGVGVGATVAPGQLTPMTAQMVIDSITGSSSGGGQTRPADDENGLEGQPGAKRVKVGEDPPVVAVTPQLFTEEQWIEMHPDPIQILIKLPVYEDKPEWGCDGSEITFDEIPITLLVGVLRDKLSNLKGIPVGRQQLRLGSKILANQVTLASLNFKNGDMIGLTIKEQRKK